MDRKPLRLRLALVAALVALTVAVYAPVVGFGFVNYDDPVYVTENSRIGQGLTADNVTWSATAFVAGNWHPLTLLSHMLDVQLFGLNPAGHHGTNLALHVANVALLFWFLVGTTLRVWPSALVAALFAVHPLNVQTVAWIAERKSLVSTLFWLLALLAHAAYRHRPGAARYLALIACAALALAAKPMAVTLPLTLWLIDVWPLGVRPGSRGWISARDVRELGPIVLLAGVCGVLTLLAQHEANAIQPVTAFSWPVRLGNAVVSYAWYLKALVWPSGLAVFYPHPLGSIRVADVAVSAGVIAAICSLVLARGRAFPAPATGWLWYVVTLVPVAGFVQVGAQAYADRYAYVPLIGVFIAIAWLAERLSETRPVPWRRALACAGVAGVAALSVSTRSQLPQWRNSVALYEHAIAAVPGNALAHNNLGMALVGEGKIAEALPRFRSAVTIAPADTEAWSNLGNALRALGRLPEAVDAYHQALALAPGDASVHYNLATALVDLGRGEAAVGQLQDAVKLDPAHIRARFLLGALLAERGRDDEALLQFREVVRLDPRNERAGEWIRRIESQRGR